MRVVHYLNQYFGGLGGEEHAGAPLRVAEEAVGPARPLLEALGPDAEFAGALIGGDNYLIEEKEDALAAVEEALRNLRPDVVVAGPAFGAGRYGVNCGEVCKAAQRLGIPAVTAMHEENPGVLEHRGQVYILPTGEGVAEMPQIVSELARFARKLATGAPIGSAGEEGYLPTGVRHTGPASEPGFRRAVDMLVNKLRGDPFQTEIPVLLPERVPPAPPIEDIGDARIALITTGGLIPRGNPERQLAGNPDRYFRYSVEGRAQLDRADWEAFHSGYFNGIASDNPNYVLPLGPMRTLERGGEIGGVHPWIFTLPGVGTPVVKAQRLGSEIAEELVEGGVDGCLLVAT